MKHQQTFIYEDEEIVNENTIPAPIIINNPGTVIIQAPSADPTIPPEIPPYNDEVPMDGNQQIPPNIDINSGPQNSLYPPVEDPNNMGMGQPPVEPYYNDDIPPSPEALPPQEISQMDQPPVDPNSGVPMAAPYYNDDNYDLPQGDPNDQFNYDPNGNSTIPASQGPVTGNPQFMTFDRLNSGEFSPPPYEDESNIDPATGMPMAQPMDPNAGMPMDPAMAPQIDPTTGQPMMDPNAGQVDPATGMPMDPAMAPPVDPATGMPIDPNAGMPPAGGIDPMTGMPMGGAGTGGDSYTDEVHPEVRVGNSSEVTTGRPIPVEDISKITELKKINSHLMRCRGILEKELDKSYNKVEDQLNEAIDYFRTIISNLDSYVTQVDDIIIKYKRFIMTILTQINTLKKQEMAEKKK